MPEYITPEILAEVAAHDARTSADHVLQVARLNPAAFDGSAAEELALAYQTLGAALDRIEDRPAAMSRLRMHPMTLIAGARA